MKTKKIQLSIICISIILMFGCAKEETKEVNNNSSSNLKYSIIQNKGSFNILEFKSEEDLYATLAYLEKKDDLSLDNWEKEVGFISMRKAFNDIADDELNFSESTELIHSELINKYPNTIVIEKTEDSCGFFDKNIHSDYLSKVVNPDGLICVAGKIYQHTKDYIKIIENGDKSMIRALFSTTTSNAELGIKIIPINSDNTKSGTATFHKQSEQKNGKLKILLYEDFIQNTSGTFKVTTYRVRVRSLKRRLWGLWYDNYNTNIKLATSVQGNATEGWLPNNNNYVNVNWSCNYTLYSNGQMHTFDIYLPYYQQEQYHPGLKTEKVHPEIYHSKQIGTISRDGNSASCSTNYN
jgi:hypothetical protein